METTDENLEHKSPTHMISSHPTPNPVHSQIPHHFTPKEEGLSESPPPPPEENQNGTKKWILLFLLVLIILIPLGMFLFFRYTNNNSENITASPTPEEEVACTLDAKICPDGSTVGRQGPNCEFTPCPSSTQSAKMETFTSEKFSDLGIKGYTISYPSTWTYFEDRNDSAQTSKLTLSKDGYEFTIYQAPMGGGGCIFEGEVPPGPFTDYRNLDYIDLQASFGKIRKVEEVENNKTVYNYCQESSGGENSYGSITSIGVISASAPINPSPATISEMDEILKSAKVN